MAERSRPSRLNLHLVLMLALTFSTGIVDAVGYLGLDKVFAGNMTGNVVILGMALAGAEDLPWVGPMLALFAFMAGAVVGGRVLRTSDAGWSLRTTWLIGVVGVVLGIAGAGLFVTDGTPPPPWELAATLLLAASMGLQAATARHIAVKDVTTVVVTSTITGLAADSRLAGGKGQPWIRRTAAIVLIAAGAVVGALLLMLHIGWGVIAAAVISLVVAIVGHIAARRALRSEPTLP
ncbi:YoaK family protein [Microbacterium sp. 3J1]|uniref:YoaK family protein n=1 Tax=Microbacterium sp. 3J1 TaxID=861269 RepID=UPI000A8EA961|nr:YoaK family protein [Microbacterium sp. 3J1]